VDKLTPSATGYSLNVKNIGGYAIPTDVLIEYTDNTKEIVHATAGIWEKNQQAATINIITKKKIAFLKLDSGIYLDADESNNTWGQK